MTSKGFSKDSVAATVEPGENSPSSKVSDSPGSGNPNLSLPSSDRSSLAGINLPIMTSNGKHGWAWAPGKCSCPSVGRLGSEKELAMATPNFLLLGQTTQAGGVGMGGVPPIPTPPP